MSQGWTRWAAVAALSLFAVTAARADDAAIWKARQARYAAFSAAHRHPDAEIASIKAKTAAKLAKAAPFDPAAVDKPPVIWRASAKPVALCDPVRIVIGEPHGAGRVLVDQRLERRVWPERRRRNAFDDRGQHFLDADAGFAAGAQHVFR